MPEVHYDGKHLQTLRSPGNGSVCNVGGYFSGMNRNLPSLNKKEAVSRFNRNLGLKTVTVLSGSRPKLSVASLAIALI